MLLFRHLEIAIEDHVKTIYIDLGSSWQNGYIESFHSRFRDECLNREWLLNLREAASLLRIGDNITTSKERTVDWAISVPKNI